MAHYPHYQPTSAFVFALDIFMNKMTIKMKTFYAVLPISLSRY